MTFFDMFRRRRPIRDRKALADFIDENAAFLVQKALYEYSRARAGHYAKVLFAEAGFKQAVERARWQAYPLGLAMVGEAVHGVLRATAKDPAREFNGLAAVILSVFDRYPVPEPIEAPLWHELRADLERRLQLIPMHPPKRVMDIPENFAKAYFELMPIHEKLRGRDFPTTLNYLKVTLCNIHDEFTKRLDPSCVPALWDERAGSEPVDAG